MFAKLLAKLTTSSPDSMVCETQLFDQVFCSNKSATVCGGNKSTKHLVPIGIRRHTVRSVTSEGVFPIQSAVFSQYEYKNALITIDWGNFLVTQRDWGTASISSLTET